MLATTALITLNLSADAMTARIFRIIFGFLILVTALLPGSMGYHLCSHLVGAAIRGQKVDQIQVMRFELEGWAIWAVAAALPLLGLALTGGGLYFILTKPAEH